MPGSDATKYRVRTTTIRAPETAVAMPTPTFSSPPEIAAMFFGSVMNFSTSSMRLREPGAEDALEPRVEVGVLEVGDRVGDALDERLDLLDQGRHDEQHEADGDDGAGQEDDGDRPSSLDAVLAEPLDHRVEAQGRERRQSDVDEDRRDVGQRDSEQQRPPGRRGSAASPTVKGLSRRAQKGRPWPFSATATDAADRRHRTSPRCAVAPAIRSERGIRGEGRGVIRAAGARRGWTRRSWSHSRAAAVSTTSRGGRRRARRVSSRHEEDAMRRPTRTIRSRPCAASAAPSTTSMRRSCISSPSASARPSRWVG